MPISRCFSCQKKPHLDPKFYFWFRVTATHNNTDFKALTALVKEVSLKVVENGGIIRSVRNHGLRTFPHRFKAKYPDILTQQRYYEQGRFVSVYYDANPSTLKQVEAILTMNDQVLRHTHLKTRSKLDWINHKHDKNPYIQEVLRRDRELLAQQKAEDEAIEAATDMTKMKGDQLIEHVIDNMKDA
jgi:ribosomal protein S6